MPDLFPEAKFIGQAKVRGCLYDLGEYPCLLLDEAGSSVLGEVYEIDDEILRQLDESVNGFHQEQLKHVGEGQLMQAIDLMEMIRSE